MKDVGFTKNGGRLVEMSEGEYHEFTRLHNEVEGIDTLPFIERDKFGFVEHWDFTKTFHVIRAYHYHKHHINQFQRLLDDMKAALQKES